MTTIYVKGTHTYVFICSPERDSCHRVIRFVGKEEQGRLVWVWCWWSGDSPAFPRFHLFIFVHPAKRESYTERNVANVPLAMNMNFRCGTFADLFICVGAEICCFQVTRWGFKYIPFRRLSRQM